MKDSNAKTTTNPVGRAILTLGACLALTLTIMVGQAGAQPASTGSTELASTSSEGSNVPLVQQFEDVPPAYTFYDFINALYLDDIISGYACGGAGEPCGPGNLPYYRPNANVTRGQMSKFVDNGRRNISHATGLSLNITDTIQPALTISSTTYDGIYVLNSAAGGQGIDAHCSRANAGCTAIYGFAYEGNRPGWFLGGRGTIMGSNDNDYSAAVARAYGIGAYAVDAISEDYRGATVRTDNTSYYSLIVEKPTAGTADGIYGRVDASFSIAGDLWVSGSKAGYVIDVMQNAGGEALEAGDVVVIVGSAPSVMGDIPVVRVAKSTEAYSTGVVGVVDHAVYVPDQATMEAYESQEQARKDAFARRDEAEASALANGTTANLEEILIPPATITDQQASLHSDPTRISASTGEYVSVVTLGSYKAVKVDASFGAIHAGDLLTSSPHAGYAMKATDRDKADGAIIGKALSDLETGSGIVPVMVTLK